MTDLLPRKAEPANVVPPVDEQWRALFASVVMGDIGGDQHEYEFEPMTAPAVPEPVAVPEPEKVPVPA